MVKVKVTLNLDYDLRKQAEEKNVNLSQILEKGLIEELDIKTFEKANQNLCEACKLPVNNGEGHVIQDGFKVKLYHKKCIPAHYR